MNIPMHRLPIHHQGRIMKALFGLIVGMWSSLAVADERSLAITPGREFSPTAMSISLYPMMLLSILNHAHM